MNKDVTFLDCSALAGKTLLSLKWFFILNISCAINRHSVFSRNLRVLSTDRDTVGLKYTAVYY